MEQKEQLNNLPKGWVWSNISELFIIIGGGTPSKKHAKYWGGDIKWASVKDIKSQFLTETIDKITNEGLNQSNTNLASIGDIILVTRIAPGQVSIAKEKITINQDLKILKLFGGIIPSFVYFLIKSNDQKFISRASGTTVKGLKVTDLNNIKLPLPPLKEQSRIIIKIEELFSEIDHATKNLQKAKYELDIYKQSILKSTFTGKLSEKWREENTSEMIDFEEFSDYNLPNNWKLETIENVSEFIGSGSTPKGGKNTYTELGIPFIRSQNVHVNKFIQNDLVYISEEINEKMKRTKTKPRDILLNITGASIGRCAYIPEDFILGNINQHVCIIRVNSDITDYKYLTFYLNSPDAQIKISQINSGATREALTLTQIKRFSFPLCNKEEQTKIVEMLETRFTLIENLETIINKSFKDIELFKHTTLKKAFEGKLVNQDPLEESANTLIQKIKIEKSEYLKTKNEAKNQSPQRKNL
ncbi:restriction endonuclease subunit S [Adhaeribacter pallidiroseus]|uniref:Type I site-specific deoxyribonuclease n=1 Tax=Adhaeribacter pallidiroseus TaxID=2072847 RepID=A0A369QBU8_9BACT|nr:restriction endonuclease subunit S [Adhaeribacter pallidiroseus]RDC62371.1 Type I site-specific deoxyribonuclease [Adhaeribacter pallidiroseus]